MGFFSKLFNSMPFDEVVEKTSFFIRPQLSLIEEKYGSSKYSVITWESVAYTLSIACHIAGRQIKTEEVSDLLLPVFGESYEARFNHLGRIEDMSSFLHSMQDVYDLAGQDVENGMLRSSNYMVNTAELIKKQFDDMRL